MNTDTVSDAEGEDLACRRCGTCCRKGGPALHLADRNLVDSGRISPASLFTIRRGEMTWDNVRETATAAETDIIRVKSAPGSPACVFLDADRNACRIYEHRFAECRALNCRDIHEITAMYDRNRLTRRDVMSGAGDLLKLIEDHQAQCDYGEIGSLVEVVRNDDDRSAYQRLGEIIQFDRHLRRLVFDRGGVEPEWGDFIFGRPLVKTLVPMGLKINEKGDKIRIYRTS